MFRNLRYARSLPPSYLFNKNLKQSFSSQFNKYLPNCNNYIFLSTGRCAIKLAIRTMRLTIKDEILLPSYLDAEGVLHPVKEENISYRFYKVKRDLSADIADIRKKISDNTKALLIIHYFGFPQPIERILEICEAENIFLIEDCAHAFLSKYNGKLLGSFGDFSIFTYRKTLPIPDGASLIINNPHFTPPKISKKFDLIRSLYSILETISLIVGNYSDSRLINYLNRLLAYFSRELINIYSKPTSPSYISQVLISRFNLDKIISIRRDNFRYLLENVNLEGAYPLYTELPEGVCPLWFPMITKNRDILRKKLIKRGIPSPIFWRLPKEIDEVEFRDSWEVSAQILSIPLGTIHKVDMSYIVKILKEG